MRFPTDWTADLARKPICGVLAVSVIAGVTFAEATKVIKANMLPHQKRHGGKTYHEQRLGALTQLGVTHTSTDLRDRVTLQRYINLYTKPHTLYMINVTGHVVTYRDGLILDQRGLVPFEDYPNRRQFVINVTEILCLQSK